MKRVKLIQIGEDIEADNRAEAARVRRILAESSTYMMNLMSSPGAGKTSLILRTAEELKQSLRIAVVEADMDSQVDAEKLLAAGVPAVQLRTGGFCHADAHMISKTLPALELDRSDLLILENVGNLICPAQTDTGAHLNVMILSVPEGDDKPLKYPLMFRQCEALVVNKTDYLRMGDFDMEALRRRVANLNPDMQIFEVSCKTGRGLADWSEWLLRKIGAGEARQ
ncbi:MAG: hydrogenase nickel incorporation protein HypB [Spirochaetota bacterium]